jgi:hypothetical protein
MDTYVSGSTSNALLLMMLFEGKDFQTARKDLAKLQAGDSGLAAPQEPSSNSGSLSVSDSVQISAVSITHLEAQIDTPQGQIKLEATHLEAAVVSMGHTSSPSSKQDPLLIDMKGDGPQTTGSQGAQVFDLAGHGQAAPTSFVNGGSAFLALDRNGNGRIDSGAELFGDQHGAADGYEELRKFDSDGNGRIDAQDPVFAQLNLLYGDGHTQNLAQAGIQSISLDAGGHRSTTASGDDVLRSATATTTDGRSLGTYAMALQQFDRMA